jgi:hypothetical protein
MNGQALKPERPINVLAIGMDAKKQAIFRMAFGMYTVQRYRLIEDGQSGAPDIAIVDMDCVDAESLWNEFRSKYPDLPVVITTVTPMAGAPAPVLPKPVRMEALFPLLRATLTAPKTSKKPADTATPATTGNAAIDATPIRGNEVSSGSATLMSSSSPVSPADAAKATKAKATKAEATTVKTTTAKTITVVSQVAQDAVQSPAESARAIAKPPQKHAFPDAVECFSPRHGLFKLLTDIKRNRTPGMVVIDGQDAAMILPAQDKVFLLYDAGVLLKACETPTSVVAVRPLSSQEATPRVPPRQLTALLWQISLWTSRGRLMEGIRPDMPLRLRHWPNLTRLPPIPEAMRIAAFWVRSPVNLRLTVKMLNVAPRHVFDFLAATYAIGILDVPEPGAGIVVKQPIPQPPPTAEQKERGGFLSRLLRKVVGM